MIAATSSAHTDQPRTVPESDLRLLCTLVSKGCTIKEAARYVGCKLADIRCERETNERFRRRLARAKMKAELAPLRAMQRAMLKDWRAAAWFLERTQPEKFGRRSHRAFTQKQAKALIKDLTGIIGEEVATERLFDRLSSRVEAAVRYACHAHNDTNRTAAELGKVMRHHDMKSPRYSPAIGPFPPVYPAPPANSTAASKPATNSEPTTPKSPPPNHNSPPRPQQPPSLASGASPNQPPPTPPHKADPIKHATNAHFTPPRVHS